jgi:hypothetical protein
MIDLKATTIVELHLPAIDTTLSADTVYRLMSLADDFTEIDMRRCVM